MRLGHTLFRLLVPCDMAGCRTSVEAIRWHNGLTSAFVVTGRDPLHIDYLRVRLGPYDLVSLYTTHDAETGERITAGERAAALSALAGPRDMTGFRVPLADLPGQGVRIPEGWPMTLEIGFAHDMPKGQTIVFQELVE